jgi:ligand-binding SRPBCC domain-containing protein
MAAMEIIRLGTWIDAPVERCFLLSLSVDLHVATAHSTRDNAGAGAKERTIGEGDTLTFKGRHFGIRWPHTSLIEKLRPHSYYRDVMIAGPFQRFEHDHHFAPMDDGTRMRDEVRFTAGGGLLGRLTTRMFLRKQLKAFLMERNAMIKRLAESEDWHKYLEQRIDGPAALAKGDAAKQRSENALLRGAQPIVAPRPPAS